MNWLREPGAEPIPGYVLISPLGTGGFGEVWKCEAPGGLHKAIKFVYGNLNSLDGDAARAEQEHKALQRIKEVRHPFVLSIERIDNISGELAIVMELADKSLYDCYLECQGAGRAGIPREDLLRYLRDAADGLDHLIERYNLQHLDVKPRNLFLLSERVKVADFGLVKNLERQSSSGMMGGVTPLYAAPETFSGKISKASDQYSLAIVYVELLSGQRPFNGKNVRQLAMQHMSEPPDLKALPESDRPAVLRALAKDPNDRFPNCLSFIRALVAGPSERLLPFEDNAAARVNGSWSSLPELTVTQIGDPALLARAVRAPDPDEAVLGVTQAQHERGILRPSVFLGLGSFGRKALLELRCRLVDRFGDLAQVPAFRFLYIDSDPEAEEKAVRGSPDIALSSSDLFPLPLQPPGAYRRRQLDHLSDWLPREKLYAIPRSLQPQGVRALGRLAFSDNYLRLITRLRREVRTATHPESLTATVSQSGLNLRENCPQVLVFAAGGGGSGGLLPDLGYALQHLLAELHLAQAPVHLYLYCGSPLDPATPRGEQANLYATLTELNHFYDPATGFAAQYGPDGPKLAAEGPPFTSVCLLQQEHRGPEALRDCVAHLGSYLVHDLTTPLGAELERGRDALALAGDRLPFRSFGTSSVWFPRGLLLRVAARHACQRLLQDWQAPAEPRARAAVEAHCATALADPRLRWDGLSTHLRQAARVPGEGAPADAVDRLLAALESQAERAAAQPDPGNWVRQALNQVREWVGIRSGVEAEGNWRKSKISQALSAAGDRLAEEWENQLTAEAHRWLEQPGPRLAGAEAALQVMSDHCLRVASEHLGRIQEQAERTRQLREQLQAALDVCVSGPGGFSLFGGRAYRRSLRNFLDLLAAFARQRLAEDFTEATVHVFKRLQGRLEERLRDMSFCRQRLRHLQQLLDAPVEELEALAAAPGRLSMSDRIASAVSPPSGIDPLSETIAGSATVQVVLPQGETDLERSAMKFLDVLQPAHWTRLDEVLQALVLEPLGGLQGVTQTSSNLVRHLARPLIDQAAAFLDELLPVTDVAQAEFSALPTPSGIESEIKHHFIGAVPLVNSGTRAGQEAFLVTPNTPAGQEYAQAVQRLFPDLRVISVPGQADLMFCREQRVLGLADLQPILQTCRPAYLGLAPLPTASPHGRFDIPEWVPLEP
jgi:hypothetical protein